MLQEIEHGLARGADAIVIACFDDTGIEQARQLSPVPVLGIGQAAYHLSMMRGLHFTVVTTLSVSVPVLEKPGSDAGQRISEEIAHTIAEDGCDAIILGCTGMTALVYRLSVRHQIPVIDGVGVAAALAYALVLTGEH